MSFSPSEYTASVRSAEAAPSYRLRGVIDGRETVIELGEGHFSIGSSRTADICLPVFGVSRQHAMLEVAGHTVRIADLGSTNGTSINGVRVSQGDVPVGAELRVGPVRLSVEAVRPDEDQLAIVIEPAPMTLEASTVLSVFDADKSTLLLGEDSPRFAAQWMSCIEGFLDALGTGRSDDLTPALAVLGTTLAVSGCCVVQWTEHGEPLALGSWGTLHESPSHAEACRLTGHDDAGCGAGFFDTEPPLSMAVSTRIGRITLGLMIWGNFPGRLGSGQFLRVLLRSIEHGRRSPLDDEPRTPVRSAHHPDLVFPAGYRPGTSPAMTALYTQMRSLLRGDLPVLVAGETGVGKEMVARILHESSDRGQKPFVVVNCAAVPPDLLEIELFGVEQGAVVGLDARPGKFELAEGGTLFLDEISEMTHGLQAKLSRALQQNEIHPLGGGPRAIDVRVVATTDEGLTRQLEEGALRSDLYYRLAGCVIEVPPLRACPDDVPALVEHFLRRFSGEAGVRIRGLTMGALRILTGYAWPGNIRELEHVVRRVVYMSADGEVIDARRLPPWLHDSRASGDIVGRLIAELPSLEIAPLVDAIEERLIREALHRTGGKKIDACSLLGLSRNGLDKKMKRLHIEGPREGQSP